MGIPLAAQGLRTPQFKSPLDQYGKAVQLKSLLQGQQINQARLKQFEQQQKAREQAQKERERTESLFREVGGDWEEFFKKAPGRGISMETQLKAKGAYRKDQQEYRAQGVDERARRKERAAMYGNEAAAVLSLPGEQRKAAFMQRLQVMTTQGSLTPQQAKQFAQFAQLPNEEFDRQLEMIQLSAVGATKLFDAEEKREAEKAKRTTRQKEFQSFLPTYLKSKGLPKNAKTEMQAVTSPEWKAWQGRTDRTDKPPDPKVKIRAQEVKDRSMARAVENYAKRMKELEKTWLQDETPVEEGGKDEWINRNTGGRISNDEYLAKRMEVEDELTSAQEQADQSYLEKIGTAGFEPGLPVDYRAQARARRGKEIPAQGQPQAGKTATRQEVEAFAQSKGISYQQAARQLQAEGYTIQ